MLSPCLLEPEGHPGAIEQVVHLDQQSTRMVDTIMYQYILTS